jgi:hypothetical protein
MKPPEGGALNLHDAESFCFTVENVKHRIMQKCCGIAGRMARLKAVEFFRLEEQT